MNVGATTDWRINEGLLVFFFGSPSFPPEVRLREKKFLQYLMFFLEIYQANFHQVNPPTLYCWQGNEVLLKHFSGIFKTKLMVSKNYFTNWLSLEKPSFDKNCQLVLPMHKFRRNIKSWIMEIFLKFLRMYKQNKKLQKIICSISFFCANPPIEFPLKSLPTYECLRKVK